MPSKIIVAFKTRPSGTAVAMPEFTAPSNWRDETKIAAKIQEQQVAFQATLANQPYTGTFEEVRIYDQKSKATSSFRYRDPAKGKLPACLAIRNWLLKRHQWTHSTVSRGAPEAIFVGHDMRLFVKILGIECSLPENQPQKDGEPDPTKSNALPLGMWYGQSDYRDIFQAVNPQDLPWQSVLAARGIVAEGWNGPGVDVEKDLTIATEFAAQLGMFMEE